VQGGDHNFRRTVHELDGLLRCALRVFTPALPEGDEALGQLAAQHDVAQRFDLGVGPERLFCRIKQLKASF
jgi:hypothetical protein